MSTSRRRRSKRIAGGTPSPSHATQDKQQQQPEEEEEADEESSSLVTTDSSSNSLAADGGQPAAAQQQQHVSVAAKFDVSAQLNPIVRTYLDACRCFGVKPDADLVVFIHLNQPVLRLRRQYVHSVCCCYRVRRIHQIELLPLFFTMIQTASDPEAFSNLARIELRDTFMGAAAAVMMAEALQKCSYKLNHLTTINLERQPIASTGARKLFDAVLQVKSVRHLSLRRCLLGSYGASYIVSFLKSLPDDHQLSFLDVRNNHISHHHIHEVIVYYAKTPSVRARLELETGGNQVLDEVLNAVSHLAGILLSLVAIDLMWNATMDKPLVMKVASVVYGLSLLTLYISSTLYHSFFAMGKVLTRIFKIMDHAAIYILIAGSYTPYLLTVDDPDSPAMFLLLWFMAVFGVCFHACYSGRFKQPIETTCYLVMGWIGVFKIPVWMSQFDPKLGFPLVAGGLFYTLGVPFFVRNRRCCEVPDHTIWHIFVLLASFLQFLAVYLFIFLPDLPEDWSDRQDFFVALPCLVNWELVGPCQ